MSNVEAQLRRLAKRRQTVDAERRKVSAETAKTVAAARDAGLSAIRIAEILGVSRAAIYKILDQQGR